MTTAPAGLSGRMTAAEIAVELTKWAKEYGRTPYPVTSHNVYAWYGARKKNGFPEAAGVRKDHPARHRKPKEWDAAAVLAWYVSYEPSKGGAPRGARNGRSAARRTARR